MQRWIILVDDFCIKLRRAARAKELSQKEARAGLPAQGPAAAMETLRVGTCAFQQRAFAKHMSPPQ